MPDVGSSTNSSTNAPMDKRATTKGVQLPDGRATTKEQIARLKAAQEQLWAILGLKMALDRLDALKYAPVVTLDGSCTVIRVELKVPFDFATGQIGGKDVMDVQKELENQIKSLEGEK